MYEPEIYRIEEDMYGQEEWPASEEISADVDAECLS